SHSPARPTVSCEGYELMSLMVGSTARIARPNAAIDWVYSCPPTSLPICQYLTPYGSAWPLRTRIDPHRVFAAPFKYSTSAAASAGDFPVQRTQIKGSAPTWRQS